MSSRSDQYGDETYREEENEEREGFPYYGPLGWSGMGGVWPFTARREEEPRYDEETYEGAGDSAYDEDGTGSFWDEGLITLLIVGGAILFLFPEPATSGLGVVLMAVGVLAWLVDWAL